MSPYLFKGTKSMTNKINQFSIKARRALEQRGDTVRLAYKGKVIDFKRCCYF